VNSCVISGIRVTQENATGPEIEAACRFDPRNRVETLLAVDGVSETFVLQTCIRAEVYVVTETPSVGRSALVDMDMGVPSDVAVSMDHEECLRHLIRVAAGLESFVIGENQILGQVRNAIETAESVSSIGSVLQPILSKAIHVGQRARTETAINEGPTSIAGAAVSLVERERSLEDRTVLLIGTGEMGTHIAQSLSIRGQTELLLANRTRESADRLAERLKTPASVVEYDKISSVLPDVDVVMSATASSEPVLEPKAFPTKGRTFVVDIAQPRDIPRIANDLEGVDIHDLTPLKSITERARERRRDAIENVETMISEAVADLLEQYKRRRVDGVIAGMYRGAEQHEDVEALADALVSSLLAPPTASLRQAVASDDWRTVATAIELFKPENDQTTPTAIDLSDSIDSITTPDLVSVAESSGDG
jgi:glutamyl-tRNA reductase